jgi:hypothetical protein
MGSVYDNPVRLHHVHEDADTDIDGPAPRCGDADTVLRQVVYDRSLRHQVALFPGRVTNVHRRTATAEPFIAVLEEPA